MNNVTHTLTLLRATNSSTEKKKILEENKSDLLAKIFIQAYDPFITFGISKIDASDVIYSDKGHDEWWEMYFDLLNNLSKRVLTGHAARDAIKELLALNTKEGGEILLQTLKKDLRMGGGVRLINKVYENLLPEDFCMSANKYDKKRVEYPVYADTKLDGVRCIAVIGSPTVLFSRNGKEFTNYTTIEAELGQLGLKEGTRLDGEITMGHFQDLMKTVSRRDEGIELAKDAVYNIFDVPESDKTFIERHAKLMQLDTLIKKLGLTHVKVIEGQWIASDEELDAFYKAQLDKGQEGAMIKTGDGLYEFKRGWGWQKMKPEHSDDLEIIGTEEGRGKYERQLGVFVCRLENGGEVRVGSGLKDEEREELWNRREELIGQIVEVKYQEKTKDGSLRFPIFIKFRPDKS